MSELSRLHLKAIRSLPPEEQDVLLEALLDRLAPWPEPAALLLGPGPPAAGRPVPTPSRLADISVAIGPEVTPPPLGPETGGPWQSVPVRLSTEQHERLKQWCQANGFTMAVVLRGLVARFLDEQATRRPRPATGEAAEPPAGTETA
jgi:hypothetical protein